MKAENAFRAAIWPALLCVLLYASGLGSGLVYDDETLLVDSSRLVTATPKLAFTSDFWGLPPSSWRSLHYRPLAMLAYSGINQLFGTSWFAFHSANVLMHAAATASFYWLLLALGFSTGVSMAAALLFAVHPLHVESVEWMSGMTETQVSALMMGSLACFAYGRRRWSLLLAAAAMLTKEAALILPALISVLAFLYSSEQGRWPKWRSAIVAAIPYALLAALYLALRSLMLPHPPPGEVSKVVRQAWPAIPGSAAHYLKAIFWPWPLAIHYELPGVSLRLAMLLFVALWIVAMLKLPSLRDDLALCSALIALPLAIPVLTSPLMVHWLQAQDRYAYFASSGACLMVAVLLSRLPYHSLIVGCLLLVPAGAFGVSRQLHVWESDETLWTHTLEVTPSSKAAALNLGYALYLQKRFTEAEVVYLQALRYHPNDPEITKSMRDVRLYHPLPKPRFPQ